MKIASPQTFVKTLLLAVCISLPSCSEKHSANSGIPKSPLPFDQTEFSQVTPMLDGSAYATDLASRLWYLRGSKAVRVTELAGTSQKMPEFDEITPVLDGGAYAMSFGKAGGLWYLRAEHAEKVTEVPALADAGERPQISDKVFYALYLSERKKRQDAEERADNPPEAADDSSSDWDPYP